MQGAVNNLSKKMRFPVNKTFDSNAGDITADLPMNRRVSLPLYLLCFLSNVVK